MNYYGAHNFRPNKDGTFGPKKWSWNQLRQWALDDMKPKRDIRGELVELIFLWALIGVMALVGVGVLLWIGCHK